MMGRICEKVSGALSDKKFVLGIFQNGSTVVGLDVKKSDVDFTVVVLEKKDINKVVRVLKRTFAFLGVENEVPHFSYRGKKIGVCIYEKKTMDFFVKVVFSSKEGLLTWQRAVQHKFIEAKEIYDPSGMLKGYLKRLEKYPEKLRKEVFCDAMGELDEFYDDWKEGGFRNSFQFTLFLGKAIETICVALYAKNKKFFMIPGKRLHADLKVLKPNIEEEMKFLVKGSNSEKNILEKRKVFKRIIGKLRKKSL